MAQSTPLLKVNRWIIVKFAVLMVVMAALAGNGMFRKGSMDWLLTGHQHLGNLLFALAVIQMVISYVMYTRKTLGNSVMISSALVFLFTFAQIGLGYSTRSNMVALVGWHIALGVALTAVLSVMATQLWLTFRHTEGVISGR